MIARTRHLFAEIPINRRFDQRNGNAGILDAGVGIRCYKLRARRDGLSTVNDGKAAYFEQLFVDLFALRVDALAKGRNPIIKLNEVLGIGF